MLTYNHPNTFLFMLVINLLCKKMNIKFFKKNIFLYLIKNENYMELPVPDI